MAPALTIQGAFTWVVDIWYHVAATRDGSNNVRLFVDGVQVGSTTSVTFAVFASASPIRIGKRLSSTDDLGDSRCKVDILPAIVSRSTAYALGVGVRASNLVVPQLLIPADRNATDVSINLAVATLGLQAKVQAAESQFGGGALEFSPGGTVDPSQAFVSYPDLTAYDIGSSQFTIECWVRFKDLTAPIQVIASKSDASGDDRSWELQRDSGNLSLFLSDDGTTVAPALTIQGAFTWVVDIWYHVAATRDGSNNVRLFVDGVQVGSTTSVTFAVFASASPIRIGKRLSSTDDLPLNGFVDDFRFIVGSAEYTAGFTTPTLPHPTKLISEDFDDRIYRVTTAGTSAATVPTFDSIVGNTTTDGSVVFTAEQSFRRAAVVATVVSDRVFTVTFPNGADARAVDDWFKYGGITWDTGSNIGLTMEVKANTVLSNQIDLFLDMPFPITVGDKLGIYAGCDRKLSTCIAKFNNVANFRGEPYVPGQDQLFDYPDSR